MRTTLEDGREVKIVFKHDQYWDAPKVHVRLSGKETRIVWDTRCQLVIPGQGEDRQTEVVVGEGHCRCSWEDRHVFTTKEDARQVAFERARRDMREKVGLSHGDEGRLLQAYFGRSRHPGVPKAKGEGKAGLDGQGARV